MEITVYKAEEGTIGVEFSTKPGEVALMSEYWIELPDFAEALAEHADLFARVSFEEAFGDAEAKVIATYTTEDTE